MTSALLFVAGLVALIVGAELLVRGASKLALTLGLSPLVVGLTVVAFGTSAPEMAVAIGASLKGSSDIVMGNVVGSNIANVLLILGASAIIVPLTVDRQLIRQEVPIMIGVSVLVLVMALDGAIGRAEGLLLVIGLVTYIAFTVVQARRQGQRDAQATASGDAADLPDPATGWDRHWSVQIGLVVGGLVVLVLGAQWLVSAAVDFARAFGISEAVIGLTVVAIGTSMPELAASVAAALRGQRDMAVGNVVGSNLFNLLGCLGISTLVGGEGGVQVAPAILTFDLWVMVAAALACLPVFITGREIARWEGALFLGYLVAYGSYLVLAQQQHDALPMFSNAMLVFVVPLTVVTLVVTLWRNQAVRQSAT